MKRVRIVSLVVAAALAIAGAIPAAAAENATASREAEFLNILRSDAPAADKAIACKQLAIYGSEESVPYLAALLPDPQLASWARIALEAIPGKAADDALRTAMDSLEGHLLVGAINSLGVRRASSAIEPLTRQLQSSDAEVASAAAVALGRIGNSDAARSLQQVLAAAPSAVRSSVAEGYLLCAEQRLSAGQLAQAAEIYDEIRQADLPRQRILEATRGAILARSQEGIPLLLEQFQSPETAMFQLALSTAREFPGREVDQALADELTNAVPERAALIVQAMADRTDTVLLPTVLKAAETGPREVRLSAIDALARVGDASCFSSLLAMAVETDVDVANQAKNTLAVLPDEQIDSHILSLLPKSEGKTYPVLIELVGQRRLEATPDLIAALNHADQTVRSAALIALGETVSLEKLSVLLSQVVSPRHPEDAPVAQQALKAASIRMADREACAALLASAIDRAAAAPTKIFLLETLGAMGGTNALASVAAAARSADPQLQDAGSRLLGEWMTEDAAPVLLDLARTAPGQRYQVRALRGYIRIARQFDLPEAQRFEMIQKAFDASSQPAEQKLVLEVLRRYPSLDALKLAIRALQIPEIKNEADQTVLSVAQRMSGMSRRATPFYLPPRPVAEVAAERDQVAELLSAANLDKVQLEIVSAEYGNTTTQQDVTSVLREHAGDSPVITLKSPSYKEAFGGDSLPEGDRQLKIKYRMNGKPGEATFLDDALIVLLKPQ